MNATPLIPTDEMWQSAGPSQTSAGGETLGGPSSGGDTREGDQVNYKCEITPAF